MLKKTINYKALDGSARKGDFYFHLSKAKLAEMALVHGEDYEDRLKAMIDARDAQQVIDLFKDLIRDSYGERDRDGIHFIQSPEVSARFEQTDAWSELFVELVTDAQSGSDFFNGVMPAEISERMRTGDKIVTTELPDSLESSLDAPNPPEGDPQNTPSPEEEPAKGSFEYYENMLADPNWQPTQSDIQLMNQDQMRKAFARKMAQG